jgi:hypothetical protein
MVCPVEVRRVDDAAAEAIAQPGDTPELALREDVARGEARAEVAAYIRDHPGSFPFDIAVALQLPPDLVGEVVEGLVADGTVEREVSRPSRHAFPPVA